MKIVVLDGETTNPGDLSWERLEKLGELTVYARTKPEELYERAKEAELLITNKTVLSGKMIRSLKNLKYIGTLSTGFNVVDIHAARELGIPVCNVPSYCTNAVAQMTFSLLFALTNHVALHNHSVHQGDWENSTDFCYWKAPLVELESKNFGVYGFGSIGRTVAKIAADLGMNVLVYSRTKKDMPSGYRWVSQEELFRERDVLSLHCPLTPETTGLVNRKTLSLMKPTAYLINTSRGQVIREQDLAEALNGGKLSGAAMDVLCEEPPKKGNPLTHCEKCLITPHISWAAKESRDRLLHTVCDNVEAFLKGTPQNQVN